jgi:hypothetical protein
MLFLWCCFMQEAVTSKATLLKLMASFENGFKAVRELTKGVGAAYGELYQARLDQESTKQLAVVTQEKAALKRKKMMLQQEAAEAKRKGGGADPDCTATVAVVTLSLCNLKCARRLDTRGCSRFFRGCRLVVDLF